MPTDTLPLSRPDLPRSRDSRSPGSQSLRFGIGFLLLGGFAYGQSRFVVPPGDTATLRMHLSTKRTGVIELSGSYSLVHPLEIKNAADLTLNGNGATLFLGKDFSFAALSSSRIKFENLNLVDSSSVPGEVFLFEHCESCGISNIDYYSLRDVPLKTFARIRKSSSHSFVLNCDIRKVKHGIWLGSDHCMTGEPEGKPTSRCLIEGNKITDFETDAIATRSRCKASDPANPDSRLGHIIRGNEVRFPNINNGSCGSNHGCMLGIEVWGSDVIVEGNTVIAHPRHESHMGISLANGERIVCRNNEIIGPFTYQGIELQFVKNSIVSGNSIEGVASKDPNCAGIGVSSNSTAPGAISEGNILAVNRISNCATGIFIGNSEATRISGNTITGSSLAALRANGNRFDAMDNRFSDNEACILNTSGPMNGEPNRIAGNTFSRTRGFVLTNVNGAGEGRPFVFERNTIVDWGLSGAPKSALYLKCGTSRIMNNRFKMQSAPNGQVAATKSFSHGSRHVFTGNILENVPLTVSRFIGDHVAINAHRLDGWYDSRDSIGLENGTAEIMPLPGKPAGP